jgi:RNA polymerase sigma-70 factor (ECF subfamily)
MNASPALEVLDDSPRTETALVAQARAGSRSAFAALVERHQGRIYRLALRMSQNPSDAEEITQETFLQAHRAIGAFQGTALFKTWLYRIAINQALMRQRSAQRRSTQSLEALTLEAASARTVGDRAASAEELLHEKDLTERVRAALAALDESHRAALVLRDLEGLSSEEAADILGTSAAAVRQRAHRARLRLRAMLLDIAPGTQALTASAAS